MPKNTRQEMTSQGKEKCDVIVCESILESLHLIAAGRDPILPEISNSGGCDVTSAVILQNDGEDNGDDDKDDDDDGDDAADDAFPARWPPEVSITGSCRFLVIYVIINMISTEFNRVKIPFIL